MGSWHQIMVGNQKQPVLFWGVPGTLVINNSKLGIPDMAVGFYVMSCDFWEGYYLLSSAASISLCYVRKKHVCMCLKFIKYIHFCMTFPNILSVNYSSFLQKGVLTIFNSKWKNQQKNNWELKLSKRKWKGKKKAEIWKKITIFKVNKANNNIIQNLKFTGVIHELH